MDTRFAKSAYRNFMIWGVLTSLAMTVCTIVDALLIGNLIGSDGLAVTNLSTPVFLVYALFGIVVGVGASVTVGRLLGASEIEEANRTFHGALLTVIIIGVLCLCPLLFRDSFFRFLGVTDELMPLAQQYLGVVLPSAPLFVLYHFLSVSVRTDSDPRLSAVASSIVIFVNLSLDLVFMLVLKWGIVGASASLCISVVCGVLVLLLHFTKKRALISLRFERLEWKLLRDFVSNGFGMGSAYIFQAVVMLVFNTLLIRSSGENAENFVAIYGVLYTVSMISFAFYDGSANALATITAFFVGESDELSIRTVLKQALTIVIAVGCVIALLCFIFARQLAAFFGLPPELFNGTAASALRVFSVSIVFTGINTVVTAYWQSIGKAGLAGLMSLLRNFLLMLLIGLGLISVRQIIGLSLTFICTEVLCCLFALGVFLSGKTRAYLHEKCEPKGRVFESQYTISAGSMEQISGDLDRVGEEWEIPIKKSLFINFICEELLLNIIKFGLEDSGKEHYVAIKVMERDGDYALRVRDNVRSFNPFETQGDEIDNGVLQLIRKKTQFCDYQRKMIFNYLYLVI